MAPKAGTLGDSGYDAYRGTDNRGGDYAAVTFNPVELLVRLRGWDFGAWGNYAETRRTDYAHNWARSGAQTPQVSSQVPGLVGQIESGAVEYVLMRIGANDFSTTFPLYEQIYDGSLSGSALNAELQERSGYILDAVDAVLEAGALGVVTRTFVDWSTGAAPYNNPTGRQRVRDAVIYANEILIAGFTSYGIAWRDLQAFSDNMVYETHEGHQGLWIGNQFLRMDATNNEPHYWMLADNAHQGTVSSGFMEANEFIIRPLNERYGLGLKPLTASECWLAAGVLAGGVFGSLRRETAA